MDCLYLLDTLFPNFIVLLLLLIHPHKRYPLQDMSACDIYSSRLEYEAFLTQANKNKLGSPIASHSPSTFSLTPSVNVFGQR